MPMSKHVLYVDGFPQTTSDDQLRNLLWAYETVSHVHVLRLKHPGESASHGFVEMDKRASLERRHRLNKVQYFTQKTVT